MSAAALLHVGAIALKELRQLRRDRLTFGMIVGIPLLQILLFGYAIDLDVRHLRAGVADAAATAQSRAVTAAAEASQVVDLVARVPGPAALERGLRDGDFAVGLYFPPDFERRLLRRDRPAAQLLVDGSDPTVERVARQLAGMPAPGRAGVRADGPADLFAVRTFYNPERRSAVFIVPALIGVILNLTLVLFTAIAIVRERERGNLELLIMTPVRTVELMAGKLLPYIGIGLIQVTIVLAVGAWLFDVPLRGSIAALYAAALLFIAAALALGLLISTLARTQFQAMQLTMFTFLPSILLSGFMFPFEGMPAVARWIAQALPLTHFVPILRGLLLRGAPLAVMWPQLLALAAFFVVIMAAAIVRFHKRLD